MTSSSQDAPAVPGTTPQTIGLLGSTGHLGSRVAHLLDRSGTPHALFARQPDSPKVPRTASTTQVRPADYTDPDGLRSALAGIDTLLMVSATESPERLQLHAAVINAAAAAGVGHIVYTSFIGAAPDATFTFARDHYATEQLLAAARDAGGPDFTALRNSFYLDVLPEFVGPDGALRGPAGQGRVSAVARDDVAAVAARVLQDPGAFAGRIVEITGREALTLEEVAAVITEESGRPVRYVEETVQEAYASRAHYGAPDWQVEAWVSTYTAIAAGEESTITNAVKEITGREPKTLRDLLRS